MPRGLELMVGPILGRGLFLVSRRRSVARENLLRCFPEWGPSKIDHVLKKNYEHYGILVFELLHLFSPIPGHYLRYVKRNTHVMGLENWRAAHAKGKGVLFVASHLANWELMVSGGALAGIPITMVTKHLKPEWLHRKIEKSRNSTGVRAAYEPRTLPIIMRALRAGESVGFVLDQYAGPPIGIKVPFFGVSVGTLAAVGTLSNRTGALVVTAKTFRDTDGRINICMNPALDLGELAQDEVRTTALLAKMVENWIREFPDQWLWIHRRFKNIDPMV